MNNSTFQQKIYEEKEKIKKIRIEWLTNQGKVYPSGDDFRISSYDEYDLYCPCHICGANKPETKYIVEGTSATFNASGTAFSYCGCCGHYNEFGWQD